MKNFPTIVCLCGSTRFKELFEDANAIETNLGRIVLSVGRYGLDVNDEQKKMLDELHLRKIDLASEILVIAPHCRICPECKKPTRQMYQFCACGRYLGHMTPVPYIGESTRKEIEYAVANNKTIRYFECEL